MKMEENKSIRFLKLFEIELLNYLRIYPHLDLMGRIQLNYSLKKRFQRGEYYRYRVIITIKDEELWEQYFDNPQDLKQFFHNYCRYFNFEFTILKPFQFLYGDKDVFSVAGGDIEKRISYEYFTMVLNSNYRYIGNERR